ncbi:bone morphogenetic protein 2 [Trichomycterus rosablanca]|uniref:bone morphogenetic protein 2 n=1 Tax=Trichomycterus rosablanca TaxID=2290929 RepID=UPI002F35EADC
MEFRRYFGRLSVFIILNAVNTSMVEENLTKDFENKDINKAILELLHINKLSVLQQTKPHPYMMQVYLLLNMQDTRQRSDADVTLVQSFRSVQGTKYNIPGWIWFKISHLRPSMTAAELILLRKTLYPEPLTITVTVHSILHIAGNLSISGSLTEQQLTMNQPPPSGYDVFNVTAALSQRLHGTQILGFQLRFKDENGSLVLHEALTQSLYCLNGSSLSQPLLVAYRDQPVKHQSFKHRQRQYRRDKQQKPRQQRSVVETTCKLSEHHINIHNTELSQWILQPTSFNISFCRGVCMQKQAKFSVAEETPQIKSTKNNVFESSNCVPELLSSVTVMYRSDTDDIFIKELKEIRAEKCLCQPKNKY